MGRRDCSAVRGPAEIHAHPLPFPNLKTPVDGLLRCGDSVLPGHPVRGGLWNIAANTIVNVDQHIYVGRDGQEGPALQVLSPGPFQRLYRGIVSGTRRCRNCAGAKRPRRRPDPPSRRRGDGGVALGGLFLKSRESASLAAGVRPCVGAAESPVKEVSMPSRLVLSRSIIARRSAGGGWRPSFFCMTERSRRRRRGRAAAAAEAEAGTKKTETPRAPEPRGRAPPQEGGEEEGGSSE